MEPKQAVAIAKQHVMELFGDESITNLGLEEIESDSMYWKVTIGFSRPWDMSINSVLGSSDRAYKVIKVDGDTGCMISIKDRILWQ